MDVVMCGKEYKIEKHDKITIFKLNVKIRHNCPVKRTFVNLTELYSSMFSHVKQCNYD